MRKQKSYEICRIWIHKCRTCLLLTTQATRSQFTEEAFQLYLIRTWQWSKKRRGNVDTNLDGSS